MADRIGSDSEVTAMTPANPHRANRPAADQDRVAENRLRVVLEEMGGSSEQIPGFAGGKA
ncbi:MAG TPA: hypothetical protein VHC70_11665 [Phycisphaerales bacterium]|jgi:hypothetical protein|nr:hypothetical protein [Phycisphaerales bacterium]